MTDYVKSLKVNSVSHPVLGAALENPNTSAGAVKDLKVWQGTADEFRNHTSNLYAWSNDIAKETETYDSSYSPHSSTALYIASTDDYVCAFRYRQSVSISKDLTIKTKMNNVSMFQNGNCLFVDDNEFYITIDSVGADWKKSTDGLNWSTYSIGTLAWVPSFCVVFNNTWYCFSASTSYGYVTSTDKGQTWTTHTGITLNSGVQVSVVNDKLFVCSGSGNSAVCYMSSDGENWTQFNVTGIRVECYVNGTYYGRNSMAHGVYTSTDGVTWTLSDTMRLPSISSWFYRLSHNGKRFIVNTSKQLCYSDDLITWSYVDTTATRGLQGTYNVFNHDFVGLSSSIQGVVTFDANMTVYTDSVTPSAGDALYNDVETVTSYSNNVVNVKGMQFSRHAFKDVTNAKVPYIFKNSSALCDITDKGIVRGNTGALLRVPLSSDDEYFLKATGAYCGVPLKSGTVTTENGTKEFKRYSIFEPVFEQGNGVAGGSYTAATSSNMAYGNGYYITGTASDSNIIYSSTNGIDWTSLTLSTETTFRYVQFIGEVFLISSTSGTEFFHGPSPSTLTAGTAPVAPSGDFKYGGNKIIILSSTDIYYSSSFGVTWSQITLPSLEVGYWCAYRFFKNKHYVFASSTTDYAYSDDCVTWTTGTLPCNGAYQIATNDFMAIGTSTNNVVSVYTSTDGITWTAATVPATYSESSVGCNSVSSFGFFYNLNTPSNKILSSSDGITWNVQQFPYTIGGYDLIGGPSCLMFTPYESSTKRSISFDNGLTWNEITMDNSNYFVRCITDKLVGNFNNGAASKPIYSIASNLLKQKSLAVPTTNFNSSSTQTLKNVNGTLTWVTDAT